MFAGNLRGVTQTLPLLIYQDFELASNVSLAISALLVVVSAAVLITVKVLVRLPGRARGADAAFMAGCGRSAADGCVPRRPSAFLILSPSSYVLPRLRGDRMGAVGVSRRALLDARGNRNRSGRRSRCSESTAAPAFAAASIADLSNVRLVCVHQAPHDQLVHDLARHAQGRRPQRHGQDLVRNDPQAGAERTTGCSRRCSAPRRRWTTTSRSRSRLARCARPRPRASFALALEDLATGIAVGAAARRSTSASRESLTSVVACDGQHLGALSALGGALARPDRPPGWHRRS